MKETMHQGPRVLLYRTCQMNLDTEEQATYARVNPSGEMILFPIMRSVDGPRATILLTPQESKNKSRERDMIWKSRPIFAFFIWPHLI